MLLQTRLLKHAPDLVIGIGPRRVNVLAHCPFEALAILRDDRQPAHIVSTLEETGVRSTYFDLSSCRPIFVMSTPSIRIVPLAGSMIRKRHIDSELLPAPVRPHLY